MACCGPSKSNVNEEELFKKLRNNKELIVMKLGGNKYTFNQKEADWTSNYLKIFILLILLIILKFSFQKLFIAFSFNFINIRIHFLCSINHS